MTEEEWLASRNPRSMCRILQGKATERKVRLLMCACCRLLWHLFQEPETKKAVELAELDVEGLARREEIRTARSKVFGLFAGRLGWREDDVEFMMAQDSTWLPHFEDQPRIVFRQTTALAAGWLLAKERLQHIGLNIVCCLSELEAWGSTVKAKKFCQLIREVFGHRLQRGPQDRAWQTWNDGTVVKVAQTIYDERAFERMPILADALEDAGCDDADILRHCREPGEHVRGCWVVDLLLGKQ
jgi:hypothetical protein